MATDSPLSKPNSHFGKLSLVLLGVFAVVMYIGLNTPTHSSGDIVPVSERKVPSNPSYRLLGGEQWQLDSHRGKVVVINLWATWCGPCRQETPALANVYRQMKPKGVEMIGLSFDQGGPAIVERFVADNNVPYPQAMAPQDLMFGDGIPLPTTLVYDKTGRLAARLTGAVEEKEFRDLLDQLLKEPV